MGITVREFNDPEIFMFSYLVIFSSVHYGCEQTIRTVPAEQYAENLWYGMVAKT